jgi:hypothetical protein
MSSDRRKRPAKASTMKRIECFMSWWETNIKPKENKDQNLYNPTINPKNYKT